LWRSERVPLGVLDRHVQWDRSTTTVLLAEEY
jgi:hypothetical protein